MAGLVLTPWINGWAVQQTAPSGRVETALHYDLQIIEGGEVSDASGHGHHGVLRNASLVYGRNRNALRLQGDGAIEMKTLPEGLNPQGRSFTVGAYCQPESADGVLIALGDQANGFSLYLKEGVPHFAVRSDGQLTLVAADRPVAVNQWVHLAGVIDSHGEMSLLVNGWSRAEVKGTVIAGVPSEPLTVGADRGSPVGDYTAPLPWQGLVQDVRIYWGVLDKNDYRDQWQEWAQLPGCGCRGSSR